MSALADYDDVSLQFDSPAELLPRLPATSPPDLLSQLLGVRIKIVRPDACALTSPQACFAGRNDALLARMAPDTFRVDLLIRPDLLPVTKPEADKYLQVMQSGLTLTGRMRVSEQVTQPEAGPMTQTSTLLLSQTLGNGPTRGVNQVIVDSQGNSQSTFYLVHEWRDLRLQGGQFETAGASLMPNQRIEGFSAGRSFLLRQDLSQALGTPIQVFVPETARVEILRDGLLFASGVYGPGNQTLDTQALPEGSYNISVRVIVRGVTISTETFFFSKSARLPPTGDFSWRIDSGLKADGILAGAPVRHAEVTYRPVDNYALSLQWQSIQLQQAALARLVRLGKILTLEAEAVETSQRTRAVYWRANLALGALGSLSMEDYSASPGPATTAADDIMNPRFGVTRQQRLRFQRGFLQTQVAFEHITVEGLQPDSKDNLSLSWISHAWFPGLMSTLLLQRSLQDGLLVQLGIMIPLGSRGDASYQARLQASNRPGDAVRGELGMQGYSLPGLAQTRSQYFNTLAIGESDVRASSNVSVGMQRLRVLVNAEATVRDAVAGSLNASVDTAYTLGSNGFFLFSPEGEQTGFVAELESKSPQSALLMVNNQQVRLSRSRQFVSLPPYRNYDVELRQVSGASYQVGDALRRVSVMPGLVPILKWRLLGVRPVYGQVSPAMKAGGIRVKARASSDLVVPGGYFTLEVVEDETLLRLEPKGQAGCDVRIPPQPGSDPIDLGVVDC